MKYSKQQMESTPQSGREPDFVEKLLQKANLPVTRENYLGLAYPQGLPENWGADNEMELPEKLRA